MIGIHEWARQGVGFQDVSQGGLDGSSWGSTLMRIAVIAALALLGSAALAKDDLAVVVAIPEAFEETESWFDVCGGEPCYAHGFEIVLIDLDVTHVLLGSVARGPMTVAATQGFLWHRKRPKGDNRHLLVLREWPDGLLANQTRWLVAEADPIVGRRACTVFPLEDYLADAVWLGLDVWSFAAEHCHTLREVSTLVARRAVEPKRPRSQR